MNFEQTIPQPPTPAVTTLPPKSKRRHIPNLVSWVVGAFVLFLLIGLAMPTFGGGCARGPQTMAIARAKQIGLALRLFASDHEGQYPRADLPEMLGAEVKDSNAAFAVLFPQYTTSETLFGNKLSAYQTRQPDNVYDQAYTGKPARTLEPGENVYSYVAGLVSETQPDAPLVVDGTDGTGHYTTDRKKRGGVWEGKKAVVIREDNSGALETLAGPDHARYIPRPGGKPGEDQSNLLDVSDLGPDVRLLDPAVGSR